MQQLLPDNLIVPQDIVRKVFFFSFLIGLMVFGYGCVDEGAFPPESTKGYAPIYLQDTNPDTVTWREPRPIVEGGKIYLKGNIMYQIERYRGIHIIDLSDPDNASTIGFYEIFGCTQMTMEGNFLYASSFTDLIVIDISDAMNPRVVSFFPDYFETVSFPPPPAAGYFECIDRTKGIVVGWTYQDLKSPECRFLF